jgi:hypothetical protein
MHYNRSTFEAMENSSTEAYFLDWTELLGHGEFLQKKLFLYGTTFLSDGEIRYKYIFVDMMNVCLFMDTKCQFRYFK